MNEFQERIGVGKPSYVGLRHAGTTRTTPVTREEGIDRGTVGGKHVEHWDGRVDAVARPSTIRAKALRRERRFVNPTG